MVPLVEDSAMSGKSLRNNSENEGESVSKSDFSSGSDGNVETWGGQRNVRSKRTMGCGEKTCAVTRRIYGNPRQW